MPRAHRPPDELALLPFRRSTGLALVSRGQLDGSGYVSVTRGARWISTAELTHGRRIQAARVVLPATAVLGGWSAAWALGLRWAEVDDRVEVVFPHRARVRSRSDLIVRGDRLMPDEVIDTDLGPATSPARTTFDLARRSTPTGIAAAVGVADALLRLVPGGIPAVRVLADRHLAVRGRRQAMQVLALADPGAESPRESALRVLLVLAGLPRPTTQFEVRDDDRRFVARLDLAWPELKIGIEYDGAHHRDPGQHSRDLRRHNALRARGWIVIQIDARQFADPEQVVALVRQLLAGRG